MEGLPGGLYERLITSGLDDQLGDVDPELVDRGPLDPADAFEVLTAHLARLARRALAAVPGDDAATVAKQVEIANEIAASDSRSRAERTRPKNSSTSRGSCCERSSSAPDFPGRPLTTPRPEVPLSSSALLVNGRDQPAHRFRGAARVGLGRSRGPPVRLREVARPPRAGTSRWKRSCIAAPQLRVITTTYIGATERRALDRLVELGAEVKVSYETRMTRLHAKAWLFHRDTGFSTAYVGSSNLSKSALLDGLEWNVRLSAVEHGHLLDTFQATFDEYWEDPAFESYDPTDPQQRRRLDEALRAEGAHPTDLPIEITTLDVRPWGYQREILDELAAEREVHGRRRNLVVMATGTGKTVVAGLDYRRLARRRPGRLAPVRRAPRRDPGAEPGDLPPHHRRGSFGERFVGGDRPSEWRHVFASVQSLARSTSSETSIPSRSTWSSSTSSTTQAPETKTYARLLEHLRPKVLLGLTGTPERADGQSVLDWFDGRIAVELRLWEALERGLLRTVPVLRCPRRHRPRRSSGDAGPATTSPNSPNVYTAHDMRLAIILQALQRQGHRCAPDARAWLLRQHRARRVHGEALQRGWHPIAVGDVAHTSEERRAGLEALRSRDVNVIFTVDLFNEGVDVPEIDTVLFLRPTESATVFLQQLGRGLRLADDKPCLTVLDFIGNQHGKIPLRPSLPCTHRYDPPRGLEREIERGLPDAPRRAATSTSTAWPANSCSKNVPASLRIDWTGLVSELRRIGDCTLGEFLDETGLQLDDIYRRHRGGGWVGAPSAGRARRPRSG